MEVKMRKNKIVDVIIVKFSIAVQLMAASKEIQWLKENMEIMNGEIGQISVLQDGDLLKILHKYYKL